MTLPASTAASAGKAFATVGVASECTFGFEFGLLISASDVLRRFEGRGGDMSRARLAGKPIASLAQLTARCHL